MSRARRTVLPLLVATLTLGPAARAAAPAIGPQKLFHGRTSPVSVPGTGLHRKDRMPTGARLVYRDVAVPPGARHRTTTLTVPRGTKIVGLAVSGEANVQVSKGYLDYVGRRRTKVDVYSSKFTRNGRVYALGRPSRARDRR